MFGKAHWSLSLRFALVLALLLAVVNVTPTFASGPVIYVKWDAGGSNNGTSWADAYTDLQSALVTASSGDEIWVAAGSYKPTSGADRTISFTLINDVALYGGFAGTETSLSQRDYQTNVTILSGDIGVAYDNADNSYHVVIGSNTDNSAVLDGFMITGGNANVSPSDKGGGMYNFHGSPSLRNLIITGNYATFGGGMNNESLTSSESSNPNLWNVSFINNTAVEGGGMRNMNYSTPTLDNVKFQDNTVLRAGGGMVNMYQNNVNMLNVEFSGNTAGTGGGLANAGSNPTLKNVTFSNNSAEWGGAISNGYSSPTITNATFYGNLAATYGGAISNESNSNPTLTNVTISGNSAVTYGGGIYNDSYGSYSIIKNSIISGNSGEQIFDDSQTSPVSYSIIQGGYPGKGNINADPLLSSLQDNGGFTQTMALLADSPAIDAGDDANCPGTDQRDVPRSDGACDIGAYELVQFTISGNTGIGGVTFEYLDGTITSDQNGNYSLNVPYGWSGTITPSKSDYRFAPESRTYTNVQMDQIAQDYTATLLLMISGNTGIGRATLSYVDDVLKTVTSDSQGNYSFIVPYGWSGTVTPSKVGGTFTPATRTYANLQDNQIAQDYSAVLKVMNTNNSGPGSLRDAINDVFPGATLTFDPALSGQTITLQSEIAINKNLTIDGSALASKVHISGGGAVKIFVIGGGYAIHDLNVVLRSLVLQNAKGLGTSYFNTGAAILLLSSNTMTVENLTFTANSAVGEGAAINSGGAVTVIGSEFISNSSQSGGGAISIGATGRLTVLNSQFLNNTANYDSGAIKFNNGWSLRVDSSTFDGNSANSYGGAILVSHGTAADVTIKNSLFARNKVRNTYSGGGAFRSVFAGTAPSTILFENNTFYANEAMGNGGAILVETSLILRHNTFSDNKAQTGASLFVSGGDANLYNNIFANNTGGGECRQFTAPSLVIQGTNNIVEDGSASCGTLPGTIIADPLLGPLQGNNGPTETMALLAGSPAIDAADHVYCPAADQRGVTRPQGAACDMGAYELESGDTTPPTVASITRLSADPTVADQVDFDIVFSEPVTGVDITDFHLTTSGVSGASITEIGSSNSGKTYIVGVDTGSGAGTIRLDVVDDDSIVDAASNRLGGVGLGNGAFNQGEFYTIPHLVTLNLNSIAANDGWILESTETSNVGGTLNATASTFDVGDDRANKQYVGLLHFDTSSLPDNAVITSVTLQVRKQTLNGADPFTSHGGLLLDIQKPYFGMTAGLVVSDFQAVSGMSAVSTFNPIPVNNWYSAIIDSAAYMYIDLTGTTQFRMRFTLDDDNDRRADSIKFYSGEATAVKGSTTTNRPQLIIQYYIP